MASPSNEDQDLWKEVQAQRERDKELAGKLIYGENPRATPEEAALMIDAARNRIGKEGASLEEVLNQRNDKGSYKFKTFNPKYARYQDVESFGPGHPNYPEIRAMVDAAFDEKRKPSRVTHYYATASKTPYWAPNLVDVQEAGMHTFGREVPPIVAAFKKVR